MIRGPYESLERSKPKLAPHSDNHEGQGDEYADNQPGCSAPRKCSPKTSGAQPPEISQITKGSSPLGDHLYCCRVKIFIGACVLLTSVAVFASQQEDRAADAVAAAFVQARDAVHLSKLERMGGNTFREKVCKHDLRFASGLILTAQYQTSVPGLLPQVAQRLAVHGDDGYRVTTRFGVGVCAVGQDSSGQTMYSVLIATYESRWNSFLRTFWD